MQVKEIKNEGLKREYNINIAAKDLNQKIEQRLFEVAGRIELPGFRPGKVPVSLVKKRHGEAVTAEVIEQEVNTASLDLLKEKELRPALEPEFDYKEFDGTSDFTCNVSFEIYPDVPEFDFGSLKVKRPTVDVDDKELDDSLGRLAKMNRDMEPITTKRAAKKDDIVVIDFEGSIDGELFEGGAGKDYRLELGSGSFIDTFEKQLEGVKAGENKTVKVTFPKEYGAEELAGKKAEFAVTIKEILEAKDAPIDDALAEKVGMESLDKLKEEITKQLQAELDGVIDVRFKKDLFDLLEYKVTFPVPEGMVKLELDSLLQQEEFKSEEDDKKAKDKEKEAQKLAERRVRLGILLADVGRKNNIEVSQEELRKAVFDQARSVPGQEQQIIEFYQNNPSMLEHLRGPILEEKVVAFLKDKVSIEEEKISAAEFKKRLEKERE